MSTTNIWASSSLSTTGSIARWESDINDLADSGSNWTGKIDAAKELLGDQLEWYLKNQGVKVDASQGEILIDVIANPTVFSVTSDYATLALIYGKPKKLVSYDINEKFDKRTYQKFSSDLNVDFVFIKPSTG